MKKKDFIFLLSAFLLWRGILFVFLFLAPKFLPLQQGFLGGGLVNYLSAPWFWSWLNFDGVHYLSIAYLGYEPLTYFYFPGFPILVRLLALPFKDTFSSLALSGLLVSNVSFFIALVGFWKLIKLDYGERTAKLSIILLLLFPTSFYLGSYYTSPLFLMLVVWSFYFARKGYWLPAGILGGISSAIRIVGLALLPALFVEWLMLGKKRSFLSLVWVMLVPVGLFIYMYYVRGVTGDPLSFLHKIGIFGQQRSSEFILLPQVFFRYFVKILPNLDYSNLPVVFTTYLEISIGLLFLILSVLAFIKSRISYAVYLALGYIIPTLSGSFSSFPRYALILFPAFIMVADWLSTKPKYLTLIISVILFILLGIATSLFVRGYWIS